MDTTWLVAIGPRLIQSSISYQVLIYCIKTHNKCYLIFGVVLPIACVALTTMILLDSYCYNQIDPTSKNYVFTLYNFFNFNVIYQGSQLYGTHPIYWYFVEALPTTLGPMLWFLYIGVRESSSRQRFWLYNSLFQLIILSLNPHKELRFLLPNLVILICYVGRG
eukprot:UN23176